MQMIEHSLRIGGRVLLAGLLLTAFLQGCVERGAVQVNCEQNEEGDGPRGCTPQGYTGSATGFRSSDGASPVPANPAKTCAAGSYKCASEDQQGCSLLSPNKKCKSYFTYANSMCSCKCVL